MVVFPIWGRVRYPILRLASWLVWLSLISNIKKSLEKSFADFIEFQVKIHNCSYIFNFYKSARFGQISIILLKMRIKQFKVLDLEHTGGQQTWNWGLITLKFQKYWKLLWSHKIRSSEGVATLYWIVSLNKY